jgi:hypothetical protein
VGPILAETTCRFRAALSYPDTVSIGARVASVGEDRFVMRYAVFSHRLGRLAAEGEGTLVHHRPPAGPPRPLALAQRERLVLLRAAQAGLEAEDPELLPLGDGRYLAPQDHALAARLRRLAVLGAPTEAERGWATVSLVCSGPGVPLPPLPDAERLPAPADRCRWMLPASALESALAALHARLLAGD